MRTVPPRLLYALCSVAALSVAGGAAAKETDDPKDARPQSDAATSASPAAALQSSEAPPDEPLDGVEPSPLEVDYAQYGVALATEIPVEPGGICPSDATVPCIIGLGGVMRWEDAAELVLAGASAIGMGTALFVDPRIMLKVGDGLAKWVRDQGCARISELTGAATTP